LEERIKKAMLAGEATPPAGAWARIEESLLAVSRHHRVVMWRRIAGVAAVSAALITGYLIRNEWGDVRQEKYDLVAHQTPPQKHPLSIQKGYMKSKVASAESEKTLRRNGDAEGSVQAGNYKSRTGPSSISNEAVTTNPEIPLTYITIQTSDETYPPDQLAVTIPWIPVFLIPDLKPQIAHDFPAAPEKMRRRWQMTGYAGRTFAGYYASGDGGISNSSFRNDMIENSGEQIIRPKGSIGLGVGFRITDRIGLQTGAVYNQFSTTLSSGEQEITVLSNYRPASNIFGELSYSSALKDELVTYPILEVPSGELVQHFSWLEVPLTGSYTLVKGPVGISVKAGFGGNILTDNRLIRQTGNNEAYIGTTLGLKRMYVSGLIGIDLYYEAGKSWALSFNPLYRQSLQPISRGQESKPFLLNLGIYSGISYRF